MNILITGASKGIGFAIAESFAKQFDEQHHFGLCSRNINDLMLAESKLGGEYPQHIYYSRSVDVSKEKEVQDFITGYESEFGAIDILVNNAGFGKSAPMHEVSLAEFRSIIDVNLRGVFLATRAALPKMRERKQGTIVAISSLSAKRGFKGRAAYSAAKNAVRGFMQCLFLEVRAENIRVITICPETVDTDFFANVVNPSDAPKSSYLKAQDVADCVLAACSLPITATLSELDVRPTNP